MKTPKINLSGVVKVVKNFGFYMAVAIAAYEALTLFTEKLEKLNQPSDNATENNTSSTND